MASCKDCLHFDVCEKVNRYHADVDEFTGRVFTDMDKSCEHFKDRSKIVELPCKVGDVVYAVSKCNNKIFSKKVVEILLKEDNSYVYTEPCYFIFEDFGKIVFLTKEEAEQALKNQN